jgi:hypothetical protein
LESPLQKQQLQLSAKLKAVWFLTQPSKQFSYCRVHLAIPFA